jgi:large subunit ribosomal protein L13
MAINRKTQELDAAGQTPGRLASRIALLLIGKTKADYAPNVDSGDFVRVVNAAKMKLTGKKMDAKIYYKHTMHPRGLKATPLKAVWAKDPSDVLRRAVSRMLPKNSHRTPRLKRLSITK